MSYHSFEELDVWKKATTLSVLIYDLLKTSREFHLRDQMLRSSVSIASNIAEGAERDSKAEFIRYLNIAKGSAAELRTQIYIGKSIKIIPDKKADELIAEVKILSKQLHALIKHLKPKP